MAATGKTKKADAATVRARALTDFDTYGLKAGQIFEGDKAVVDDLAALGVVDTHEDAIAYAQEQGAEVVTQPTEAAEQPAA